MCGLVLIARSTGRIQITDREAGERMLQRLARRGPDGVGEWTDPETGVYLGHRRLAVIDLNPEADQPFHWPEAGLSVVFNGEVYNWRELRRELEGHGHHFRTRSDTEVLVHAWAEWGREALHRLRGMYAFALWDRRRQEVHLARDPYGIKPLYYSFDGAVFRVASQVKALIAGGEVDAAADPAGWVGFLLWGSVPEPWTVYRGIRALPAGTTLVWTPDGLGEPQSHFDFGETIGRSQSHPSQDSQLEEAVSHALADSVRAHLAADVPVGAFLSAGVDSGALVGLMRDVGYDPIHTVTLGFEEFCGKPEDEVPIAELVARRYDTQQTTRIIGKREFLEDWPRILEAMDQPSVDGANTWLVSKVAHEAGLKVVLSGVGGDELFGGYPSFRQVPAWVRMMQRIRSIPLAAPCGYLMARMAQKLARTVPPKLPGIFCYGHTMEGAYFVRRGLFMPWELDAILDPDFARAGLSRLVPSPWQAGGEALNSMPPLGSMMILESTRYLRNQLLRDADWASMDHSLELRTPLVDWTLLGIVGSKLAHRDRPGKELLARAPDVKLPDEQVRRPKTGFGLPLSTWMARDLPIGTLSRLGDVSREQACHLAKSSCRGIAGGQV